MPLLGSLLAWMLVLALAIANGMLREAILIPTLGRTAGLLLSGILLSCLIALVAYAFVRARTGLTVSQGLFVGTLWLGLTLVFELGFGHYVQHKTWDELAGAYTFEDGNIWPVVLLVTFLAPPVAARLRTRASKDAPER
ncbi:MAG: hypothetical protein GX652_16295 [Burkholderiaceae bacterium]|nr:hypothetical protein [Burkholderiaceae bacterium]